MAAEHQVLLRFDGVEEALAALRALLGKGVWLRDAFAPLPVPELCPEPPRRGRGIALVAAGAAAGMALVMLLLQAYSAQDYPYVVGGKPLLSWPAFMPTSAAAALLAAVLAAVAGLLWYCRLPELHHPLFASALHREHRGEGVFLQLCCDDAEALCQRVHREFPAAEMERLP